MIRIVYADWGGHTGAVEARGALALAGVEATLEKADGKRHLKRLLKEQRPTLLLFSQGFVNQIGRRAPRLVPKSAARLQVLWIGVEPPPARSGDRRVDPGSEADRTIARAVLSMYGHDERLVDELTEAFGAALPPRYGRPVFDPPILFAIDEAGEVELHIPIDEVIEHREAGDLEEWLVGVIAEVEGE